MKSPTAPAGRPTVKEIKALVDDAKTQPSEHGLLSELATSLAVATSWESAAKKCALNPVLNPCLIILCATQLLRVESAPRFQRLTSSLVALVICFRGCNPPSYHTITSDLKHRD